MPSTPRRIVTFELPPAVHKALQDEAEMRGSASCHQRAREILVEHFVNQESGEICERIAELDSNVAYLGELLRRNTFSVMVHAGQRTSKEANEWIREHMPRNRD